MLRHFDGAVNESVGGLFRACNAGMAFFAYATERVSVQRFLCAGDRITRYHFAVHSYTTLRGDRNELD